MAHHNSPFLFAKPFKPVAKPVTAAAVSAETTCRICGGLPAGGCYGEARHVPCARHFAPYFRVAREGGVEGEEILLMAKRTAGRQAGSGHKELCMWIEGHGLEDELRAAEKAPVAPVPVAAAPEEFEIFAPTYEEATAEVAVAEAELRLAKARLALARAK